MKAFVIAMENEARTIVDNMTNAAKKNIFGRECYSGIFSGEDAVVVISKVGKTNAAAAAQVALSEFGAKEILNYGVAGALHSDIKVGDFLTVEAAVQYDFDLSVLNGTEIGTLNERKEPFIPCRAIGKLRHGRLATGDRFNDSPADHELLLRLGCDLRDMEGAAIAHVCESAGVPCRMVKCVSDVFGSLSTAEQYFANLKVCLAKMTAEATRICANV